MGVTIDSAGCFLIIENELLCCREGDVTLEVAVRPKLEKAAIYGRGL